MLGGEYIGGGEYNSRYMCTLVTTEYLEYIRGCVYNSIFYYLPADVYKLYKHVRWRVQRRWRIQQSTIMCTLVTTFNLRFLRGYVYNSLFYHHPADVYKVYNRKIHVWWRVHRMWRVPQSTRLCTLVAFGLFKARTRLCVQQYILLSSSRRVQAVQKC